jgi:hypothetical protein
VALSRHRDQVLLFGSRQELETPQDLHMQGQPRDDLDRLRRVAARLAEQAQATAASTDDRPVLDDLRVGPRAAEGGRGVRRGDEMRPSPRPWSRRFVSRRGELARGLDDVEAGQRGRPERSQPEREQPRQRGRNWGAER